MHAFVKNGAGRAATVVADTVEIHHLGQSGRLLACDCEIFRQANRIQIEMYVVMRKISQHLAAVG